MMEMITWEFFPPSGAIFTTTEIIDLLQLKLPALIHKLKQHIKLHVH